MFTNSVALPCEYSTMFYNSIYNTSTMFDMKHSESQVQQQIYNTNHLGYVPASNTRIVKKRNTANKKERRRTQSINNAFSYLREKIPNVPTDTKLSKNVPLSTKGRTGWPQDVWASELIPEHN
ncbi:heart- and neural crest derivatives-expressed protein 1 isoform X2 [Drosophila yakuba]|uniref:heart- and neural crest derivatives-expressed protein 1 isoform X2 n=1 Tax=Drosophila yakuba TaxID=7245 RepID=UPI001930804C|nr:heart- and neural crest derivatives-expressed protein 1 isoform X2 [Drosophila yakuba]XP_039496262.1 heart- and neural crest derivatives-expressed protein 1 isoform X2 [Drosophila santomea]